MELVKSYKKGFMLCQKALLFPSMVISVFRRAYTQFFFEYPVKVTLIVETYLVRNLSNI